MKTVMTIAIATLATSSLFIARADDTDKVGRYQILYAMTDTERKGGLSQIRSVWKIDTVTGRVWQFISIQYSDGKITERFVPVDTVEP